MIVVESIINNVTYRVELGDVSTLSVSQAIAAKDTAEQVAQMVLTQRTEINGIANSVTQDRQATQTLRNETEGIKDAAIAETSANVTLATTRAQEAEVARTNAVAAASSATQVVLGQGTGRPFFRPILSMNTIDAALLDDRLTCQRTGNATRINNKGFIEAVAANRPRFSYNATTLQPEGLMIERPTAILNNENQQFNVSTGDSVHSIVGSSINPLGVTGNVRECQITILNGRAQNNRVTNTNTFIWGSIFIEQTSNNQIIEVQSWVPSLSNSVGFVRFDTTTGTVIASSGAGTFIIEYYAASRNWRVSVRTLIANDGQSRAHVFSVGHANIPVGSTFRYSYMQIEAGLHPTSLVLGNFTSRGEEAFLLRGSVFNRNIGSVYVEINRSYKNIVQNSGRIVQFQQPFMLVGVGSIPNNISNFANGAANVMSGTIDNNVVRIAASYVRDTRLKLCVDGSAVSNRNITGVGEFTMLVLGGLQGTNHFTGFIRKFSLYDYELSDSEMIAMTQNTFLGNQGNKGVGHNELGSSAYLDFNAIQRSPLRMNMPFNGTGANQTYTFTLDYDCEVVNVHTAGSTFTRPTGTVLAGSTITITHNAPVGTVMILAILPIIQ
jgi:hypothetical protein